jgi:DNA modification methylase
MRECSGKYETPESRWAGVGPYYAMFPVEFADRIVLKHTSPGATVLDPLLDAEQQSSVQLRMRGTGWDWS